MEEGYIRKEIVKTEYSTAISLQVYHCNRYTRNGIDFFMRKSESKKIKVVWKTRKRNSFHQLSEQHKLR